MWRRSCIAVGLILWALANAGAADLGAMEPEQELAGFQVLNLYADGGGRVMGVRFQHAQSRFLLDLLRIQSVPQGFMWVKTIPWSDRGEPHACEHLLLGKGERGRYVAALEEMTLGSSSAWTSQLRTVYHFNTLAGPEAFYTTLEARLDALVHPNFSDEEVRREVRHIGVVEDPGTGELSLEEKGTVYTEMISSFEGPGYPLWGTIGDMLYGKDHPAANNAGGHPDSMRAMTPEHMWEFHEASYHLANMGMIAAIPAEMELEEFLSRVHGILTRCQEERGRMQKTAGAKPKAASEAPGIGTVDLPPPFDPAPAGAVRVVPYPSDNPEDRGRVIVAWPADLEYDGFGGFMLDHFLAAMAEGSDSNLYDLFINSRTRVMETGASNVYGYNSEDPGHPVMFGLNGLDPQEIDEETIGSARSVIVNEIRRVAAWPADSKELAAFNQRVASLLDQTGKRLHRMLNSPPMFGFRRGTAGSWEDHLIRLEMTPGERKSLVMEPHFRRARELLAAPENAWTRLIAEWGLLDDPPLAVGVYPERRLLAEAREAKQARLEGVLENFKKRYGTGDPQEAIARYRADFDRVTAGLEAQAAEDEIPRFIDNPPMSLDEQLDYGELALPGGVPLVASTFENMTFSRLGLALRLDVVPEDELVYLPLLPALLTDAGVRKDGQVVPYDRMQEALRREVMSYHATFDLGRETERVELVLSGGASETVELHNLLGWMTASLYAPYLEPENLPRLRDIVDQSLTQLRSRMQGREESWVRDPADAYRFQHNPLI
ncbi:MAG: hypothetical protein GF355_07835, partial [Candidatus Eisenbacteria bacterium]|nr:hypothetical protein [Candidatus Eisenbacteria bacterium]